MLGSFSGSSFSRILGKYTKNDLAKVFSGFLITSLFQSSSATTAILVSMTSVGLVTVAGSLSYLIGANIGSITTAWIVAYNITKAGIFMFAGGFLLRFIFKKEVLKKVSLFIAGLGLIFFGLEMMSDSVKFLKDLPQVIQFLASFDAAESFLSMLTLTTTGVVLTAVIQSSGATAAMVIGLAGTGVISFQSSAAVVLGAILGTTITAFLASVGSSAEGKRTAFLQIFINIINVVIGLAVFYPSVRYISKFSAGTLFDDPGLKIAIYMTCLKFILAATVFPLRKLIVKLPEMFIIKKFRLITDTFSLKPVVKEMSKEEITGNFQYAIDVCVKYLTDMLGYSWIIIRKPEMESLNNKIKRYESFLDEAHVSVVSTVSTGINKDTETLWLFLKMSDEMESMGDHAKEIAKYGKRLGEINHVITDEQKKRLLDCYLKVFKQFHEVCVKKNFDCALVARGEEIERHLRKEKRRFYSLLCIESDHDYEKRLILVDILSEYSKFNHSVKRILQVNLDMIEGRGIYLWEKRC